MRRPPSAPRTWVTLKYRPELDGLRAVAVISVILYHVRPGLAAWRLRRRRHFRRHLRLPDQQADPRRIRGDRRLFPSPNFYKRRIARLFPALYAVVLGCFAAAVVLARAGHVRRLRGVRDRHAAVGFELRLLGQSGYVDAQNLTKPLLHAWSLSVEEQFYLVWPLLLYLCMRRHRAAPWIVLSLLAAASLAGSVLMQDDRASIYTCCPSGCSSWRSAACWCGANAPGRRAGFAEAIATLGFTLML
jgi:peptidoglycan/LPS O-acetylase OafA/YrhL